MKSILSKRNTLFLSIALLTTAACGSDGGNEPEAGNAYLTIVGDSNMFVDYGVQRTLTVRYHNSNDEPLSGEVAFKITGDAADSGISAEVGYTTADGLVEITLNAGQDDAAFAIEASAQYASPAVWNIAVGSPFDLYGTYDLDSNFDMVSGLPGTLGDVVNTVVDIADGPNDPATFILDLVEDKAGFGFPGRPALDALVNGVIKDNAPDLVNKLLDMTNNFGEVARKFGTDSTIRVAQASGGEGMIGTHTMHGFHFRIDGQNYVYTNADLGVDDVEVKNVSVSMQNDRVTFSEHNMPVAYGGFLAMALEDVVIPLVDPNSSNLYELLSANVNCDAVGQTLADNVGIFSSSSWAGFCDAGLELGANAIMDQITNLSGVELNISGTSRMQETNGDRKVDSLTQGKWSGTIDYFGEAADLEAKSNTFTGSRVGSPTD